MQPMRTRLFVLAVLAALAPAAHAAGPAVVVSPVLDTRTTATGQPIVLPRHDAQLIVSRYVIQPGTSLPVHKHPYQRYGYMLSGELQVTIAGPGPDAGRVFDYKAGDFIVEVHDEWHFGTAVGHVPAVLLVIDQVEAGHAPTMLMPAH